MSIDWGVSVPPGDDGAEATYLPPTGITSLAGYPAPPQPSAVAIASNTSGSHTHRSHGHHAARHHRSGAGHHHRKTRSLVHRHAEKADVGLEHQPF